MIDLDSIHYNIKNEINAFACNVFNYYNGKININNLAVLKINWLDAVNDSRSGYTKLPNLVVIQPRVIEKVVDTLSQFKSVLLMVIIHELHHVDQYIDYQLLTDNNYRWSIECPVELMTMSYISMNAMEINNIFGVTVTTDANFYNEYLKDFYCGYLYKRKTEIDQIYLLIKSIYPFEDTELYKLKTMLNSGNFKLIIDFDKSSVYESEYKNGKFICGNDINSLNNYMSKYCFNSDMFQNSAIIDFSYNTIFVCIANIKKFYNMCDLLVKEV